MRGERGMKYLGCGGHGVLLLVLNHFAKRIAGLAYSQKFSLSRIRVSRGCPTLLDL